MCDQFFWTPLHLAAHAGDVELLELLVEAGAKVDAPTLSRSTPLMRAIESSQPSCVDFLIKAGASVNAENKKGLTVSETVQSSFELMSTIAVTNSHIYYHPSTVLFSLIKAVT